VVYCRTFATHSEAPDSIEGYVATRGNGYCNETRGISGKRYRRNGIGLDAVGCVDNSFGQAYQRKGEMRTSVVYQMHDRGP
jgi:hypothetical protein